jgi:hypothetical protein
MILEFCQYLQCNSLSLVLNWSAFYLVSHFFIASRFLTFLFSFHPTRSLIPIHSQPHMTLGSHLVGSLSSIAFWAHPLAPAAIRAVSARGAGFVAAVGAAQRAHAYVLSLRDAMNSVYACFSLSFFPLIIFSLSIYYGRKFRH